jgi:hypothetical protein
MRRCSQGVALVLAILAALHFGAGTAAGQSLGLNNASPDASSILDLKATDRGLLIPRMLEAEKNNIGLPGTPATGLLIYQTDGTPGFYYYDSSTWVALSSAAAGWGITGKAGTTNGTNFLGTTDAQGLDIRTDNAIRMRIDNAGNVGIGTNSPAAKLDVSADALINGLTVGRGGGDIATNTAFGYQAGNANTTGYSNTANGYRALYTNTFGLENTAIGTVALYNNIGNRNTANGYLALFSNIDGGYNTANGVNALAYNSSGNNNTALGYSAGSFNTTGSSNTFVGYDADAATNALTNATAIGANANVSASNTIQLGDASVTSVATSGKLTTGTVTYPNTDGSRDQVLTTNGAGTMYWQSATPIVHDWMSSHAASRHIQFNITTGELFIVGEIAHGLDFYAGGGFWWCSFGDYGSSPILTALLREYINEGGGIPGGLGAPYTDQDQYSVLPLTPTANQNTYQNTTAGNTDFPADYVPVATGSLEFFIYQQIDGEFMIAVMDDAGIFDQAPGDGTIDEDNGVRIDIAFKADLSILQGNKTRWLQKLDDSSPAYDTKHPAGF